MNQTEKSARTHRIVILLAWILLIAVTAAGLRYLRDPQRRAEGLVKNNISKLQEIAEEYLDGNTDLQIEGVEVEWRGR